MALGQRSPIRQQHSPAKQGSKEHFARNRVRIFLLGAGLLVFLFIYVLPHITDGQGGLEGSRQGSLQHRSLQNQPLQFATGQTTNNPGSKIPKAEGAKTHARRFAAELRRTRAGQLKLEGEGQPVGRLKDNLFLELVAAPTGQLVPPERLQGGSSGPEEADYGTVPRDFDWQTYLLYHPELQGRGVTTEALAKEHYASIGKGEGRVHRRLRVLLRYTACTGLINQHYSHIAAFSLAAVLGAELVLPPAAKRDSFAHYFSVFKDQNEVSWTAAPLESLLDVENIIDYWSMRGLIIHKTPALDPFPDLTQPETAYSQYHQPEIDPRVVTRLDNVYLQHLDISELIDRARQAVVGHAGKLLRNNPDDQIDYIVLDLPCAFFMLKTLSNLPVVTEVAKSMEFAPKIQALANRVIASMKAGGDSEYNAVHLRIEKDARDWSTIMGGEAVVWHNYVQAMRQANFNAGLGLYIASGLLTYGATDEMTHLMDTIKELGLCKTAHYKEMHLPQKEIDALNSEQKALLDFLVLGQGRSFVGFGSSTFSFFLREHRSLQGMPRSTTVLVDASIIGTDPLFNSAGTVI